MREWTMNTENNEKMEMISLTEDFIALETSQRLIPLISLAGIQQSIIRLQAPIVSLSAYQNQLRMGFVSSALFSFSDSRTCFYLEKSSHSSLLRRTKGNPLKPIFISNLKDEVCFIEKNRPIEKLICAEKIISLIIGYWE